jgi:hypothetical protein
MGLISALYKTYKAMLVIRADGSNCPIPALLGQGPAGERQRNLINFKDNEGSSRFQHKLLVIAPDSR